MSKLKLKHSEIAFWERVYLTHMRTAEIFTLGGRKATLSELADHAVLTRRSRLPDPEEITGGPYRDPRD